MGKIIKRLLFMVLAIAVLIGMQPVYTEAASVKLNKTKTTIYVGSSATLKLSNASGKKVWSSSNRSVATVTSNGKVVAKKAGKAVITVKHNKKKYKCEVTVKKPYLNATSKTIYKGKTYTLKITGTKAVSWKSSDKSIATVTSKGKVTAKKAGKVTITCKGKDGKSYKCKITVKNKKSAALTADSVYKSIIGMKSKYPEGMQWTNANYYQWKGGIYSGGYGCAGFAFAMSDAAFGTLPARMHYDFSKIKVGDIVRMNYDTHSVIVLKVQGNSVTVAEGNYNSSIHWGREITMAEIKASGTHVITRYPK